MAYHRGPTKPRQFPGGRTKEGVVDLHGRALLKTPSTMTRTSGVERSVYTDNHFSRPVTDAIGSSKPYSNAGETNRSLANRPGLLGPPPKKKYLLENPHLTDISRESQLSEETIIDRPVGASKRSVLTSRDRGLLSLNRIKINSVDIDTDVDSRRNKELQDSARCSNYSDDCRSLVKQDSGRRSLRIADDTGTLSGRKEFPDVVVADSRYIAEHSYRKSDLNKKPGLLPLPSGFGAIASSRELVDSVKSTNNIIARALSKTISNKIWPDKSVTSYVTSDNGSRENNKGSPTTWKALRSSEQSAIKPLDKNYFEKSSSNLCPSTKASSTTSTSVTTNSSTTQYSCGSYASVYSSQSDPIKSSRVPNYDSFCFTDLSIGYDLDCALSEKIKVNDNVAVSSAATSDSKNMKPNKSYKCSNFDNNRSYNSNNKFTNQKSAPTVSGSSLDSKDNPETVDMELCDIEQSDTTLRIFDTSDVKCTPWVPMSGITSKNKAKLEYTSWYNGSSASKNSSVGYKSTGIVTQNGNNFSTSSALANNYVIPNPAMSEFGNIPTMPNYVLNSSGFNYNVNPDFSSSSVYSAGKDYGIMNPTSYSFASGSAEYNYGLNPDVSGYSNLSMVAPPVSNTSNSSSSLLQQQQINQLAAVVNTLLCGINPMLLAGSGGALAALGQGLHSMTSHQKTASTSPSESKASHDSLKRKRTSSDCSVRSRRGAERRLRSSERDHKQSKSRKSRSRSRHDSKSNLRSGRINEEPSERRTSKKDKKSHGQCIYLNIKNRHLVDLKITSATDAHTRRHTLSTGNFTKESAGDSSIDRQLGDKSHPIPSHRSRDGHSRSRGRSVSSQQSGGKRPRLDSAASEAPRAPRRTRWQAREEEDLSPGQQVESSTNFWQDISNIIMDQPQWDANESFNRDPFRALPDSDKELTKSLKVLNPWASLPQIARALPTIQRMFSRHDHNDHSRLSSEQLTADQNPEVLTASDEISPAMRLVLGKLGRLVSEKKPVSSPEDKSTSQSGRSYCTSANHRNVPSMETNPGYKSLPNRRNHSDSTSGIGDDRDARDWRGSASRLLESRAEMIRRKYRDSQRNSVARTGGGCNQKSKPVQCVYPNTLTPSCHEDQADASSCNLSNYLSTSDDQPIFVDSFQTESQTSKRQESAQGQITSTQLLEKSDGETERRTLLPTPTESEASIAPSELNPNKSLNGNSPLLQSSPSSTRGPLLPLPGDSQIETTAEFSQNHTSTTNTPNVSLTDKSVKKSVNAREFCGSSNLNDSSPKRPNSNKPAKNCKSPSLRITTGGTTSDEIVDLTNDPVTPVSIDRIVTTKPPKSTVPQSKDLLPKSTNSSKFLPATNEEKQAKRKATDKVIVTCSDIDDVSSLKSSYTVDTDNTIDLNNNVETRLRDDVIASSTTNEPHRSTREKSVLEEEMNSGDTSERELDLINSNTYLLLDDWNTDLADAANTGLLSDTTVGLLDVSKPPLIDDSNTEVFDVADTDVISCASTELPDVATASSRESIEKPSDEKTRLPIAANSSPARNSSDEMNCKEQGFLPDAMALVSEVRQANPSSIQRTKLKNVDVDLAMCSRDKKATDVTNDISEVISDVISNQCDSVETENSTDSSKNEALGSQLQETNITTDYGSKAKKSVTNNKVNLTSALKSNSGKELSTKRDNIEKSNKNSSVAKYVINGKSATLQDNKTTEQKVVKIVKSNHSDKQDKSVSEPNQRVNSVTASDINTKCKSVVSSLTQSKPTRPQMFSITVKSKDCLQSNLSVSDSSALECNQKATSSIITESSQKNDISKTITETKAVLKPSGKCDQLPGKGSVAVRQPQQMLSTDKHPDEVVKHIYPKNKTAYSMLMNSSKPSNAAEIKPLVSNANSTKCIEKVSTTTSSNISSKKPLLSNTTCDAGKINEDTKHIISLLSSTISQTTDLQPNRNGKIKQPLLSLQPISLPSASRVGGPSEGSGFGSHRGPLLSVPLPNSSAPRPLMSADTQLLMGINFLMNGGVIPNGLFDSFGADRRNGNSFISLQQQGPFRKGRR